MALVGRKREIQILDQCCESGRAEFVAVYGRRRVGKTHLIREYFNNNFAFYATGIADEHMRDQLKTFQMSLSLYAHAPSKRPDDWLDAFLQLRELLESDRAYRDAASGRRVVFLDETPWFDTPKSNFKAALDWFWNSWASAQSDIMLVVCGSATSWMIDNLIEDHGGFYNRVTRQIRLMPFTLHEAEQLMQANQVDLPRQQLLECYMVFGGIPHYLNLIDRRMSLPQCVEQLCFASEGALAHELGSLFKSLFGRTPLHELIVRELATKAIGKTRAELAQSAHIGGGRALSQALKELEQCGFIRKYLRYGSKKNGHFYQLVDPFTLFSIRYIENPEVPSWLEYVDSPGYRAWTGLAFELVCLLHVRQMKEALGVSGVRTAEFAWRSSDAVPGAQIDLLIDRADGVVNICEMKYRDSEFAIDAETDRALRRKKEVFAQEAKPSKALHITLVTPCGVARNSHYGVVSSEISADDLFRP